MPKRAAPQTVSVRHNQPTANPEELAKHCRSLIIKHGASAKLVLETLGRADQTKGGYRLLIKNRGGKGCPVGVVLGSHPLDDRLLLLEVFASELLSWIESELLKESSECQRRQPTEKSRSA